MKKILVMFALTAVAAFGWHIADADFVKLIDKNSLWQANYNIASTIAASNNTILIATGRQDVYLDLEYLPEGTTAVSHLKFYSGVTFSNGGTNAAQYTNWYTYKSTSSASNAAITNQVVTGVRDMKNLNMSSNDFLFFTTDFPAATYLLGNDRLIGNGATVNSWNALSNAGALFDQINSVAVNNIKKPSAPMKLNRNSWYFIVLSNASGTGTNIIANLKVQIYVPR
jgi:hypothetical protein